MTKTFLDVFIDSNIGGRTENQDYALKAETKLGQLAVVCDGVGGAKGGGLASEIAAKAILREFESLSGTESPTEAMFKAIQRANKIIFEKSRSDAELRGMGTTVAMLLIAPNHAQAYTAHVGDSRIYQIRKGKRLFRTRDHSVVQNMVENGQLDEKDARHHPYSNKITKALGIRETAEIDQSVLNCLPNDVFLISSDGIHGEIDETELLKITAKGPSAATIAQKLMQTSFENGKISKKGEHDNLTIAAICILQGTRKNDSNAKIRLLIGLIVVTLMLYIIPWRSIFIPPGQPPTSHPKVVQQINPKIIEQIEELCREVKKGHKTSENAKKFRKTFANNFNGIGILDTVNCKFTPKNNMELYSLEKKINSIFTETKDAWDNKTN